MRPLRKSALKTIGVASFIIAQLFMTADVVKANTKPLTPPINIALPNKKLITDNRPEGIQLLPATPEPEAHKNKREETKRLKAEKKQQQLIEERTKAWEEAFPVVEGNSVEATFINRLSRDSVAIARESGIYPSILLAQAGLESAWGKSGLTIKYHNLFGIKGSFNGKTANLKTWEDVNQEHITIVAGFRSYPDDKTSILDYAQLLKNGLKHSPNFYQGTWRTDENSPKDVAHFLQGRYATDTQYANKLMRIIADYDLSRFDQVEALDLEITVEPQSIGEEALTADQYRVKEGDTIQLILHKTGLTIDEFFEQNDLPDMRIHAYQVVSVQSNKEVDVEEIDEESLLKAHSLFTGDRLMHHNQRKDAVKKAQVRR